MVDPDARPDDIVAEAKEAFQLAVDTFHENYEAAKDDLRFARLAEQWPSDVTKQRVLDGRPCLTINRMPAFIRQVVNDTRLNQPSIKVKPADSKADPDTAEIYNGLIRNIEYVSNADVAYDTAAESAVSCGIGYFRVGVDYTHDDTFDMDINIERVSDPFCLYGDPYSTAADSSDWNSAFVVDKMPKEKFEAIYKGAEASNWSADYVDLPAPWWEDDCVLTAEWWTRDEVDRRIVKLSSGDVVDAAWLEEVDPEIGVRRAEILASRGVTPAADRVAKTWRTRQRILTGMEVLEDNPWPGRYIPIVPVYGDEVFVDGKRWFRSLIRDAKDAQRIYNYWRTTATELVALAPRVPFIGPEGSMSASVDAAKWATANRISHAYLEFKGGMPPARQPLDTGAAAGALQEALNAADDMKAIIGLYDASLGARSNETSGRAILARQREGDVSTFHFQDNLARAIRHAGRIIIDLIPHIYNGARIVRVLGEEGAEQTVPINQPTPAVDPKTGAPMLDESGAPVIKVYDLSVGKYDLTVASGPSFSTRREEAASQMMEFVRLYPAAAPVIGDLVAKNLDWPGADAIAERLQKMLPSQLQQDLPPEVEKLIAEGKAKIEELTKENDALKADKTLDAGKLQIEAAKAETGRYAAETDRMQASARSLSPEQIVALVRQTIAEMMGRQAA